MKNLEDLEKKINSELTTKINKTEIKHNQIYLETDKEDLVDICLFLKTNKDTKFRQLIDITVVDYYEQRTRNVLFRPFRRFAMAYFKIYCCNTNCWYGGIYL